MHNFFKIPESQRYWLFERDIKPRNMNFAKFERMGVVVCVCDKDGGGICTDKYGKFLLSPLVLLFRYLFIYL